MKRFKRPLVVLANLLLVALVALAVYFFRDSEKSPEITVQGGGAGMVEPKGKTNRNFPGQAASPDLMDAQSGGPRGIVEKPRVSAENTAESQGPPVIVETDKNLLINSGFADGLEGWKVSGEPLIGLAPANGRDGGQCLSIMSEPAEVLSRIREGWPALADPRSVSQDVAVDPARPYVLSFWTKGQMKRQRWGLSLFIKEMANGRVVRNYTVAPARYKDSLDYFEYIREEGEGWENWEEREFRIEGLDPKTTHLRIILSAAPGLKEGPIYVDDFSLKSPKNGLWEIEASPDTANLLVDGQKAEIKLKQYSPAGGNYDVAWKAEDYAGSPISAGGMKFEAKEEPGNSVPIPLDIKDKRFASVTVELSKDGESLGSQKIQLGVLPKKWDGNRDGRFGLMGISIGDGLAAMLGLSWDRAWLNWLDFTSVEKRGGSNATITAMERNGLDAIYCFDLGKSLPAYFKAGPQREVEIRKRVKALVESHGARATVWESANEPNLPYEWPDGLDDFLEWQKMFYQAFKEFQPDSIVLGPCPNMVNDMDFIEKCIQKGVLDNVDVFSVHTYSRAQLDNAKGPDEGSPSLEEYFGKLNDLMDRYGVRKPIWVTETGFCLRKKDGRFNQRIQADMLVRSVVLHLACGVEKVIYFSAEYGGGQPAIDWGIFSVDRDIPRKPVAPRPAAIAYGMLINEIAFKKYLGKAVGLPEGVQVHIFGDGERQNVGVIWAKNGEKIQLTLPVNGADVEILDVLGQSLSIEPMKGKVDVMATGSPIYIKGIDASISRQSIKE